MILEESGYVWISKTLFPERGVCHLVVLAPSQLISESDSAVLVRTKDMSGFDASQNIICDFERVLRDVDDEKRSFEAMTIKHMSEGSRLEHEHDVRPRRLFVDAPFAARF